MKTFKIEFVLTVSGEITIQAATEREAVAKIHALSHTELIDATHADSTTELQVCPVEMV